MAFGALLTWGCILQGPWDFWPEEPETYQGIWVYAHVISGRPVTDVCFEPLISLDETYTNDFAFYDSASVRISGHFSGVDTTMILAVGDVSPNCFDGPADLVAENGQTYTFDASIVWDSAGHSVTSDFHATSTSPEHFSITGAFAPAVAMMQYAPQSDSVMDVLAEAFGDTVLALRNQPAAWDTFVSENQQTLGELLEDVRVGFTSDDTLEYLRTPWDLLSNYFISDRSDDIRCVLTTLHHDSLAIEAESSFSYLLSDEAPDSAEVWGSGTQEWVTFMESMDYDGSNLLDSLYMITLQEYIGHQVLYFYAAGQDYLDYFNSAVENASDSRYQPKTNIEGGKGIFAAMAVDSFPLEVKSLPGTITYPYVRTRVLGCREDNWKGQACRVYLETFCQDSLSVSSDCRAIAVEAALDSGLAWDALMFPATGVEAESAKVAGERRFCIHRDYPDSSFCETPYEECNQSADSTLCKHDLWDWCTDEEWPIDSLEQCGNGLVSWIRLKSIKSSTFARVRDRWCAAHADDAQCLLE
ncbi:MAG TPA: hypothetical protein VLM37_02575 [Fibrobacteraceae bacterium]|nr:hypothetical protein [Fibrobacteraceae bacterium]